jgi:hypothetical protein
MNREDVRRLAQTTDSLCVTIYLPLAREPAQQDQNRIRLKNHLAEAQRQLLEDYGWREPAAKALLQPAHDLIAHGRFLAERSDGLALFLSATGAETFNFPFPFDEELVVGPRFHLKPLLPQFMRNGRFYILALSQNEVRLLEASQYSVRPVELGPDVPENLADALKWDDPEAQLQWHTSTVSPAGRMRPAVFHGHGVGDGEDEKVNILRYFQLLDQGLSTIFREEDAPLVLAGVDYLIPIYREASSYRYLTDESISGNPKMWSPEELHERAWQVVEPLFKQEQLTAVARYAELAGGDRASAILEEVVPAAHYGQIELLFVIAGATVWGQFDPDTLRLTRHEERELGDSDLLGQVAVHTFVQGGTVYVVEPADMPPGASLVAAILRYPLTTTQTMPT